MVGFSNPPNDAALVRTVLAGDPVGLRTGRKDREAVGARRGLVQEVGSDVLGLPRHRPADPLGRGGRAPDPMAGRFSDLAVASTNHRKAQASSTAAGGAYVLRRLTPPQTAKVQLRIWRRQWAVAPHEDTTPQISRLNPHGYSGIVGRSGRFEYPRRAHALHSLCNAVRLPGLITHQISM